MQTLKITKNDLDENNYYKKDGIGWDGPDFEGNVEIESNLGLVRFKKGIYVTGNIIAKAGSGIEAGWGIEAGEGIEAGWGIKAGWCIKAGEGIVSLYSWIKAKLNIEINSKCTIIAGCFSTSGAKEVEAQKIVGNVAYGNVKLLKKEEEKVTIKIRKSSLEALKESGIEVIE